MQSIFRFAQWHPNLGGELAILVIPLVFDCCYGMVNKVSFDLHKKFNPKWRTYQVSVNETVLLLKVSIYYFAFVFLFLLKTDHLIFDITCAGLFFAITDGKDSWSTKYITHWAGKPITDPLNMPSEWSLYHNNHIVLDSKSSINDKFINYQLLL